MENTEEIYTDFARVYDELMDNTPYEMWCNRLDQLIASYGVSRPTRDAEGILDSERNLVVDLGCGTGTLTELLYQKGYDCIGVDNSEEMLGIAMEKKVESGSEILYLHQDMRELDLYYYDPEEEINEYDLTIFVQEEGDTFHRFTETHLQRGYTVEQMRTLVEQAGLKILEIMDSDTGEAVTETSERVYIVAKEQQKEL